MLTGYNVRRNEKGDPRDDDEEAGGQVVRDDVRHHVTLQILENTLGPFKWVCIKVL